MRNLKKVIALIAVFAMLVSCVAFAQTYTDVEKEDNYYEAIEMLSRLSIFTGDMDDNGNLVFRSEDSITRAEAVTIIERIQNVLTAAQTATEFKDVPSTHWASGFIAQATAQSIVNGYGDGYFGPDDPVLYEQMVKMLIEALGYAPFVYDNGGYYAGHMYAAQRYGVLDDVIGGTIGQAATRGQVAQMVYNAIDTPLMDRSTYGTNAEYVIYDTDDDYRTLLKRDLKVVKGTGVIDENQVTTLSAAKDIDNEKDAEIRIDFDPSSKEYVRYDLGKVKTIYDVTGEAGALIGKEVTVYLKETSKSGEYDVISVAETSRNRTLEIGLDEFDELNYDSIKYTKKNARTATTTSLIPGFSVLYNGVAVGYDAVEDILNNCDTWSGKITLIDNGADKGYNVVAIDIATSAVVDEVTSRGTVNFLNNAVVGKDGKRIELDFDEDNKDTIIVLTDSEGFPVSYEDLTKWDVLSILSNDYNDYYVVEVINSNVVEGSISEKAASKTSATGSKYYIDGKAYDAAENCYGEAKLKAGAAGSFYIDKYGKIVAYDKNGSSSAVVSDKYAFVLDAAEVEDDWSKQNVKVQILDKSGKVYEGFLANTLKIKNADKFGTLAEDLGHEGEDDFTIKVDKSDLKDGKAEILAKALKNSLITYEANTSGELKTIEFAVESDDEEEYSFRMHKDGTVDDYDAEDKTLKVGGKKFDVNEDTYVFFISGGSELVYVDGKKSGKASKTASKVSTIANLADGESYDFGEVFNVESDVANAVVIYNTTGGVSSSSTIAVIDTVGTAKVDGDEVPSVTYWKDGEKNTAYGDVDLDSDITDNLKSAQTGEIWKFAVSEDGSTITDAKRIAYYYLGEEFGRIKNAPGETGAVKLSFEIASSDKVDYQFGPAVDYSSSKNIKIGQWNPSTGLYDFDDTESIKGASANVYVVDPARKNNQVYVGTTSDVNIDKDIINRSKVGKDSFDVVARDYSWFVPAEEQALGLIDFVAAVEYDGDVTDIVIYKTYDLGKYKLEVPSVK